MAMKADGHIYLAAEFLDNFKEIRSQLEKGVVSLQDVAKIEIELDYKKVEEGLSKIEKQLSKKKLSGFDFSEDLSSLYKTLGGEGSASSKYGAIDDLEKRLTTLSGLSKSQLSVLAEGPANSASVAAKEINRLFDSIPDKSKMTKRELENLNIEVDKIIESTTSYDVARTNALANAKINYKDVEKYAVSEQQALNKARELAMKKYRTEDETRDMMGFAARVENLNPNALKRNENLNAYYQAYKDDYESVIKRTQEFEDAIQKEQQKIWQKNISEQTDASIKTLNAQKVKLVKPKDIDETIKAQKELEEAADKTTSALKEQQEILEGKTTNKKSGISKYLVDFDEAIAKVRELSNLMDEGASTKAQEKDLALYYERLKALNKIKQNDEASALLSDENVRWNIKDIAAGSREGEYGKLGSAVKELREETEKEIQSMQELGAESKEAAKSVETVGDAIKQGADSKLDDELKKASDAAKDTKENVDKVTDAMKEQNQEASKAETGESKLAESQKEAAQATEKTTDSLREQNEELSKPIPESGAKQSEEELQATVKKTGDAAEERNKALSSPIPESGAATSENELQAELKETINTAEQRNDALNTPAQESKAIDQENELQSELKETTKMAEDSREALSNVDTKNLDKLDSKYEEIANKGKEISNIDMISDSEESVGEINKITDSFEELSGILKSIIDTVEKLNSAIGELNSQFRDNAGLGDYFSQIEDRLEGVYAKGYSKTQRIDLRSSKKELEDIMEMYQRYKSMGGTQNIFDLTFNQESAMKMQRILEKSQESSSKLKVGLSSGLNEEDIKNAVQYIVSENEQLGDLQKTIKEVTNEIELKTEAIATEQKQMDTSVQSEVASLKELINYIEQVKDKLTEIGSVKFTNTTKALKDAADAAASKAKDNTGKNTSEVDKNIEQFNELLKLYDQLINKAQDYQTIINKQNTTGGTTDKEKWRVQEYEAAQQHVKELTQQLNLSEEQQEQLNKAVERFSDAQKRAKENVEQTNKEIQDKKNKQALDDAAKSAEKAADAQKKASEKALKDLEDRMERINKLQKEMSSQDSDYRSFDALSEKIDESRKEFERLHDSIKQSGITPEIEKQVDAWEENAKAIEKTAKNYKELDAASNEVKKFQNQMELFLSTNSGLSDETRDKVKQLIDTLENGVNRVEFDRLKGEFSDVETKAKMARETGESFFDALSAKAKEFGSYLLTYVSFQDFIRYAKEGLGMVHEFDDALTEMSKVSNESFSSLREYQKESFGIADSIGTEALTLQQSTADFMRLGESMQDAAESAKAANVLMNVSEFDSISEATDSLIAMSYAYQDLGKMDIIDKLNNIGNNYAISTDGIASALQNSAAALSVAGNDMDEAIALVTAGNQIIQDPKKVGNGLRTIALRLTGTKEGAEQLESLGEDVSDMITTESKLRSTIMEATKVSGNNFKGFDILDDNGNYKSTYEILLGISEVYDQIVARDKETHSNNMNLLLETLAGKNRANIAASILQNGDLLREVYEDSQVSFGSAMEENQKYMDSISGHIAQLKNAYAELWATSINRETINFFIDLAKSVVTVADKLGLLKTALLAITTVSTVGAIFNPKAGGVIGSIFRALNTVANTKESLVGFENVKKAFLEAENGAGGLLSVLGTLKTGFSQVGGAATGLFKIIASNLGTFVGVGLAIAGVSYAIYEVVKAYDELNVSYKDTVNEIKQIRKEYSDAQAEIKNHAQVISDISDEYARLSKGVNEETNANISLSTDEYDQYLDICNQIADMYPDLVKGYDAQGNAILTLKGNVEDLTQALIEEKKAAAQSAINGGEAGDARSIMDAWRQVLNSRQTGYNGTMSAADSIDYLNQVLSWDDSKDIFYNPNFDPDGLVSNYAKALRDSNTEALTIARKAILEEIDSYKMEIEQRLSDVKFLGNMYLTNGDDFYGLSERGQTMGNLLVEGMSKSVAEGFIDENGFAEAKLDVWTDNIIKDIQKIDSIKGIGKDANGKDKTLLDNIFEFKTEDKTLSEIRNFRQKAIDAFSEAGVSDETTLDFFDQINLNEDSIVDAMTRASHAARDLVRRDLNDIAADTNFHDMFSGMTEDQLEAFIEIANGSKNASEALKKWNDIKKVAISLSNDMAHTLETEQGVITGVQTAITESASATGLSFANKNYIQETFGAMKGYDYDRMFMRTATGMKVDAGFLNEMTVERNKKVLADYNNALAAVLDEEERLTVAMGSVEVGSEAYAEGQKNLELLRERKQLLAEELTQYEALISTYNRWIQAQSQADSRSNWESMASGFERIDQLVNAGFIGDAEVKAWVDLLTYEDMATASVKEYMEAYQHLYDEIEGTYNEATQKGYTVKDFFMKDDNGNLTSQSLQNYITALRQIDESFADINNKTIDVSNIDAFAKSLGISKEMATELTLALQDIGWDVIGQQAITAVADANRALEELNRNGIFDKNGHHIEYQIDFDTTNVGALETYISDIRGKLDEFRDDDGFINFETEGANELVIVLNTLLDQYKQLTGTTITTDVQTNAQEALDRLNELKVFGNLEYQIKFDTTDIGVLDHYIDVIKQKLADVSDENSVNFNKGAAYELQTILDLLIQKKHDLAESNADVNVNATGAQEAEEELRKVGHAADEIDGKTATMSTRVEGVEESISQINNVNDSASKIDGKTTTSTVKVTVDNAELRAEEQAPTLSKPIVKKVQVDKSEEQAYEAEKHEGTITMDVGINKEKVDEFMATDFNKEAAITFSVNDVDANLPVDGAYDITSTVTFDKDSKEVDKYDPENLDRKVTYGKESGAVDNYNPQNHTRSVKYELVKSWDLANFNPQDIHRTVFYNVKTIGGLPMVNGTAITNGHAYASGTAFAKGDWGTKSSGTALGGELGTELLVRDGKWQTIGEDGAEFFNFKKGDIIFNAEQTKQLFENGKITTGSKRGTAFAEGTAFASGSSYEQRAAERAMQKAQEQAVRDAQRAAQNAQREQQRAAQQAQREAKQLEREAARQEARKKERELLSTADYIERLVNKLGRAIEKLNSVVEDTTRNWGTRNYSAVKEISSLNDQLANQKLAAQKYQKYLDGLQKSYGLTADRINMVKNGAWTVEDIYNMSARTGSSGSASQRDAEDKVNRKYSEGIQHYIEFYDKMTAAQDAAIELTSQIRELFIKMFDQISTNYLGQLQTYELVTGVINQRMETIEASGGIVSEKYYSALSSREDSILTTYMKQRENMVIALEELVRNGTVGTNSEEYYRMSSEIDKITLSIEESKTKLAEFAAEIRNIRWEKFDRLQKSLENIVNESDFLIDLLEGEEESLYDKESGLLTDYGMAALGLHESNYEVYIDQAKRYANEIKAINKDLAEDPYNQELLDRRQELLEAQQDSIAAAQDEKNTIKDLMTNTIEKEVESLKTLIKTYTDTLDAEKDLYNYQKNIRDKSKNVNDVRKQLSAYENDDSEEGRARRQQLEAQLADAEEALKDTQYDHYFSEHKELLDNLYAEYEKQAKERANKTDNLIKDTINAINRNSANISDTISKLASSYGYDMSDSLDTILTKDSSGKTDTKANTAAAIRSAVAENNAATNDANNNADTSAKGSRTSYGDSRADGWYEFGGQKYYVQNGQQVKGLQKIDGKQYYFDANTNQMATDQFVSQGGKKYYVGSEGTVKTGWNKINNKQYYMDKEGVVQTGWQTISGHRYNFGSDGVMKTGSQKIGGQYYLFNNKGWMQTGVQTVSGKKYLYDSSTGARAGNGKGDSWVVQGKRRYRVDKTGQVKANQWIGSDYYTDSNGAAVTGFKTINKKTYYFDPNNYGKKMIYEQTIGGKTYYFNGKGEMQTGWIKFNKNNKWRYFNSKGEMLKGWQTIDKKRYYLDPNGGWRATGWQTINGNRYYFDGSGVMQTGEKKIGQKYYYFNSSGVMQTGPVKVGNKTFLYGKDGAKIGGAKSARWVDFNGRKYYVNTDGSLKTSAWIGKKYVNGSGAMLTGWNKVGGKQYYFNGSGDKVTGWQTISGHRYNFGTDGVMKTGLQTIGGKKYHFNSKGWMTQNAWQTVSGKKYYFGNDGAAYTNGAKKIDGKGYYFDKNGIMQANTTVTINKKKYKIDKNGVIQGYRRGVQNLSTGQMAWTQEGRKMEAIIRPSDGAILTPLAKGDSVLNSKATANLFDFANDPQKFLKELKAGFAISPKAVTSSKDVNIKNDVNLQVVLPNVKNYEEFKAALQRDKNFENMIRSMTTDKMFGGSSLAKYKFA